MFLVQSDSPPLLDSSVAFRRKHQFIKNADSGAVLPTPVSIASGLDFCVNMIRYLAGCPCGLAQRRERSIALRRFFDKAEAVVPENFGL
jgi:hypothetical protein